MEGEGVKSVVIDEVIFREGRDEWGDVYWCLDISL